jgi:hypothetical protein
MASHDGKENLANSRIEQIYPIHIPINARKKIHLVQFVPPKSASVKPDFCHNCIDPAPPFDAQKETKTDPRIFHHSDNWGMM